MERINHQNLKIVIKEFIESVIALFLKQQNWMRLISELLINQGRKIVWGVQIALLMKLEPD